MRFLRFGVVAVLGLVLSGAALWGQQLNDSHPLGSTSQTTPNYLKDAGLVERLNQPLPLKASFVDETGKQVALDEYFHKRPVAMALVYFKCTMLCPQVLHGLSTALRGVGFTAGKDYDVVVVSIDPMDTPQDASSAKKTFLTELGQPDAGNGVHFLTGQQAEITALSEATGFHYVRVPGPDGKMDQFAHSSVVMFATPDGRMSEYLAGIDYPTRDVRLALVNASNLKIASAKDLFLLYCCNYVPSSGKYTVAVLRLLGLAAGVTLIGMGIGFYFLSRKRTGSGLAA
ncbi:SCO family protein [Edaphobacter albus]|uniref:SCO family protein n=1 Tax=Edaphobacter sp. 4G125 TaxID=2763071 RepID=UPI00164626C1|nr:SCO family protein [Edaphobacter sp. 4G125]QNI36495.1 SCO family protein [Edaphobacter sp. 4G125]